jgi:hypothetical protein
MLDGRAATATLRSTPPQTIKAARFDNQACNNALHSSINLCAFRTGRACAAPLLLQLLVARPGGSSDGMGRAQASSFCPGETMGFEHPELDVFTTAFCQVKAEP